MSVAKVIEISSSSETSFEDAIDQGIKRACRSVDNVRGAWIKEQKVSIENGRITKYRVNMQLTFVLDGGDDEDDEDDDMDDDGARVLVLNGPNINMLGIREPSIYGRQDYQALLSLCHDAADEAGFSDCTCLQSNHEGDLVDYIQDALGSYDGIVINPGAYTHTSVAILDAVKAVSLPCVEIHISNVDEREDFRKVSYIRQACFETVTGMGIEGYRKAILDLAEHLGIHA